MSLLFSIVETTEHYHSLSCLLRRWLRLCKTSLLTSSFPKKTLNMKISKASFGHSKTDKIYSKKRYRERDCYIVLILSVPCHKQWEESKQYYLDACIWIIMWSSIADIYKIGCKSYDDLLLCIFCFHACHRPQALSHKIWS